MTKCFLKREIRKLEVELVNARQAAKAASKQIEALTDFNRRSVRDNKAYNIVIQTLIAGGDPCPWCDEQPDCPPCNQGHGCKEWCIKFDLTDAEVNGIVDKSETVSDGGSESGAADQIIAGATGSPA